MRRVSQPFFARVALACFLQRAPSFHTPTAHPSSKQSAGLFLARGFIGGGGGMRALGRQKSPRPQRKQLQRLSPASQSLRPPQCSQRVGVTDGRR